MIRVGPGFALDLGRGAHRLGAGLLKRQIRRHVALLQRRLGGNPVRVRVVEGGRASLGEGGLVAGFRGRHRLGLGRARLGKRHRIEEHGRPFELVEDEEERPGEQDHELHRQLGEGVEDEREAALAKRTPGEIALHLALVAAEVGEHQEEPAEEPRPDGVGLARVGVEGQGLQPAGGAGDPERLAEAHLLGEPPDDRTEAEQDAEQDDQHLPGLDPHHGAHAPEGRVDRGEAADEENRERRVQREDHREDHRRRIDHHRPGKRPPEEEEQTRERPRVRAAALLQVLVSGEDTRPVEQRHQGDAQDHHGDGKAEVDLDEPHPVHVGLAGRTHQRDGARLGGHHRQAHGVPGHRAARQEVVLEAAVPPPRPVADGDDQREVRRDDDPVEELQGGLLRGEDPREHEEQNVDGERRQEHRGIEPPPGAEEPPRGRGLVGLVLHESRLDSLAGPGALAPRREILGGGASFSHAKGAQ